MDQITQNDRAIMARIFMIDGEKVMMDSDLAELYQVDTKVLNQAVKRNRSRFPSDFMFQLSEDQWKNLKSQFATASWGGRRTLPYVFTEQGVAMLSSVLNSGVAMQVNIQIIRVFTKLRSMILTHQEMLFKLEQFETRIGKQDEKISAVFDYLKRFIREQEEPRKRIGYR